MNHTSNYQESIVHHVPRILTQIDLTPTSPTYGCADRTYWHYKTSLTPSARYQEIVLTLALVYTDESSTYFQQPKINQAIAATMTYWSKSQLADGSFCEWYPQEHSFVATAFSLYAMVESARVLPQLWPTIEASAIRSGNWLTKAPMQPASNQIAGAAAALATLSVVTINNRYKKHAEKLVAYLESIQTKDGWIPEYGGADIGYTSVLVDYLAKYHQHTSNINALNIAGHAVHFLSHFMHPDCSTGGAYGSRNTAYIIPSGIEYFAAYHSSASAMLTWLRDSFANPLSLDDRYLCYNGYTLLQAHQIALQNHERANPTAPSSKLFADSGIRVHQDKSWFVVHQPKKGGVIKIFSTQDHKLKYSFAGITAVLNDGNRITSQYLSNDWKSVETKTSIITKGTCYAFSSVTHHERFVWLFTAAMAVVGRVPYGARVIKSLLRNKLITKQPQSPVRYTQQVSIRPNRIKIKHTLELCAPQSSISSAWITDEAGVIYVPSSKMHSNGSEGQQSMHLTQKQLNKLNTARKLSWTHTI